MKNVKIRKQSHSCKVYAGTYNVKIFNSCNPRDAEFAMRNNLIGLMTELKGFKFVATLLL